MYPLTNQQYEHLEQAGRKISVSGEEISLQQNHYIDHCAGA
jgi:hypothetical protein